MSHGCAEFEDTRLTFPEFGAVKATFPLGQVCAKSLTVEYLLALDVTIVA